jgi:hypothetical protein
MQSLIGGLIVGFALGMASGYQVHRRYMRYLGRMERYARRRIRGNTD